MSKLQDIKPKPIRRIHHCVIWPTYEDEGFGKFTHWEIFYCDCKGKWDLQTCECYYESEPIEIAFTWSEVLRLSKEIEKKYRPIVMFGLEF